ncbi:MAG TPA: sigma-54 dependent transcriptional regulator [Acidobacteriota bacterium]|nr:sigma-54 dependent transcriptional regulator [Acidobacteriota bacterium]
MDSKTGNTNIEILVIDDDGPPRKALAGLLTGPHHRVHEAVSTAEGTSVVKGITPDVILAGIRGRSAPGPEIVREIRESYPGSELILLAAPESVDAAEDAVRDGAFGYLVQPCSDDQVLLTVRKAVQLRLMRRELTVLREHVAMSYGFDNIIGISKQITQLKETARRIAATDITILITGPSGTGKELFARAIHHHSDRRDKRFVTADCAAIPESLLESGLFGCVAGSHASAKPGRPGLLEEADGGTLFLDEVGRIPASVQAKLLCFLSDSEVRPLGASTSRRVDVRVVAATSHDLAKMVADGELLQDLYYRLSVIPLNLPTLAERAEDIEILIDYLVRKICRETDRQPVAVSRPAVDRLRSHTWPGNVRELENTLRRGIALCSGGELSVDDISFVSAGREPAGEEPGPARRSLHLKGHLMDSSQRSVIVNALNDNNWNYTRTATELGIGRTTLWRKIRKYDLRRELVSH